MVGSSDDDTAPSSNIAPWISEFPVLLTEKPEYIAKRTPNLHRSGSADDNVHILIFTFQLALNSHDVLSLTDLQDTIDLSGTAKQLDRASVAHAQVGITVDGEVVDQDIRYRDTAG